MPTGRVYDAVMPSAHEITTFGAPEPPEGASPWVDGHGPGAEVAVVEPDPSWPAAYDVVAARIRAALGGRVRLLEHVGSTSVPGLAAKPIIDVLLVVADVDDEDTYVPALVAGGFVHAVREPWWDGHRLLRYPDPRSNVHLFRPDSPEAVRMCLLRDWLRDHPDDRERYAATKRAAAADAIAAGEHVMQYNARKQPVVREIYGRAFRAAGLLD